MKYQKHALLLALLLPAVAMAQMNGMDMSEQFAFGQPAQESAVTRTIYVEATDTMRLKFDSMRIRRGEVVKFVVRNSGQAPHEFAIGDESFRKEHLLEMRKQMAGMEHHDVNVLSLKGGETKTIVWRFDPVKSKSVLFACYVPGHFEAGMYHRHVMLK
ncbi:hypothetical protein JW897_08270 [Chromobacterium alkanivorans]|uniref:cupredoxin domain-containing protein n=1 Tax=Chromobacterium alkanivorans TaxID=1071719 RepID=UPI0019686BE1|nr:hypothetical protein [Chromobacterium alkanivorans]MBN3003729.1 hypothetical protein [Chromobacterium alkanivorans]